MTGPATQVEDLDGLGQALEELTAAQAGRIKGFAVRVEERDGVPVLAGQVLSVRQARAVEDLARRHGARTDIAVIADPAAGLELGWVEPTVEVLDTWREPSRAGEEMGRQDQYMKDVDGALRRLGEDGDFLLVQGVDLAVGWAARSDLRDADPDTARATWADVRRVEADALPTAGDRESLLSRARQELGVPYVWGGTTHEGFDCSGLILRLFREVAGVMLPRHTGDQRRVGERVVAGDVRAGDLLFAAPRTQRVGHVLLMTSERTVLHACRTEHRVIEEELEENARRYQHQGWRRPVLFGA